MVIFITILEVKHCKEYGKDDLHALSSALIFIKYSFLQLRDGMCAMLAWFLETVFVQLVRAVSVADTRTM